MTRIYTPSNVQARLQRLLGGAELGSLRQRMRRYFERVENGTADRTLLLKQLSPVEHEALAVLLGRPAKASRSIRVDIEQLDRSLQAAGIADSLRAALELIDGPIENHAATRANLREQWSLLASRDHWCSVLHVWMQDTAALGMLKRLSRQDLVTGRMLLERADTVLRRLPAQGIARSQLAAETLGDAHALDAGQPTATIVVSAWRSMQSIQVGEDCSDNSEDEREDLPQSDDRTRDIWARAGVLVNELARPALFLNLPVASNDSVGGSPGEPSYVSLRRLLRSPPVWSVRHRTVFVCENPNILAIAADHLGEACAPLVCTDGMPAAAQRALLNQLVHAGANLRYHGDFDWPGLHIGNQLIRALHAHPWRFTSVDYETAVQSSAPVRHRLSGARVPALWDATLSVVMQHHGTAIAEEAVVSALLEDLAQW